MIRDCVYTLESCAIASATLRCAANLSEKLSGGLYRIRGVRLLSLEAGSESL